MTDVIKKTYFQRLALYFSNHKFSGPWTRKWYEDVIDMFHKKYDLNAIAQWSAYQKNLQDMYTVVSKDDGYMLMRILKSNNGDINTVPVVPWEDAFDIIWMAHVACEHGDQTQTMNLIKPYYYINIIFVETLINICNCNLARKERICLDYNAKGSIQIIDMTSHPDEAYKYILMYIDIGTGFMQLRPLKEMNELEVSLELVEIFTDLGPPIYIVVYEPYFYDNVIENVNKVFYPRNILLNFLSYDSTKSLHKRSCQVIMKLNKWMQETSSKSWKVGCHIVQLQMNFTPYTNMVPYQLVFRNKINSPNFTTRKTNIPATSTGSLIIVDDDDEISAGLDDNHDNISTPDKLQFVLIEDNDNLMENCGTNQFNQSSDPIGNETHIVAGMSELVTNALNDFDDPNMQPHMSSASSYTIIHDKGNPNIICISDTTREVQEEQKKDLYSEFDSNTIPTTIKIEILSSDDESNSN